MTRFHLTAVAVATAALLAACGGGADDTPNGPTTILLATKVVDGPIANALVCFDLNDNADCDFGEPSTRSAADGTATVEVQTADVGKHGLVAVVDTDAVDAVFGPVTTKFTLQAPATKTTAVTPLSTLVARFAAAQRVTADEAEAALRDQAGVGHALSGDFTAIADAATRREASALSRSVLLAIQSGRATLAAAVGRPDRSGTPMTAAAVDAAALDGVAAMLDSLVELARTSAADTASSPADRDAALRASVRTAMASGFTLTPANVAAAIEATKASDNAPHVASGGSSLAWLAYTDAANWSFREFRSTLAQDTPDAGGNVRYVDARRRSVGGTTTDWGAAADFTRTEVYWTGSRWFACPVDHVNLQTLPDANGARKSTYCDAFVSTNTRRNVDIAGKTMASVVADIRAYALPSTGGVWSQWGPDPATLGGATFPAGSLLRYQTTVQVANPDTYNPAIATNVVTLYASATAAGNQASCNAVGSESPAAATRLEDVVARNTGTPCVYTPNATTGPRHEWWGNSTVSLNGGVPGTASLPFYAASRSIRVSFVDRENVQYWTCPRQASNNSPRNCDRLGTGKYAIETRGDSRVLTLSNQPVEAAPAGTYRLFVEREGKVWYGYRNRLSTDHTQRLNGPAADALFAQLGVTR